MKKRAIMAIIAGVLLSTTTLVGFSTTQSVTTQSGFQTCHKFGTILPCGK